MSYKTRHDVSFHHQESSKIQLLESIKTNTENINVNIGDVEINTADLEVLQTLTNTKLQTDLDFAGQPNAIGDGSNMKRTMNYGYDGVGGQQRPLVVDGSGMLKVVVDSGAGTATEAKQDILEASLTSIESKMDIDNVVYDNILVKNTEIKDHLSNIDGLLDVQNELHLPGIDTKLETLETSLTSIEGKMDIDNAVFDTISSEIVSIDGKIKNGNDASLSTAQQVLTYGRTNTGDLHPLHITNNGDVEVEIADFVKGQATMAASFPVVLSSDQSSLTVDGAFFQATQPISGTVTANLSTTDNAVLDVIAANTADLENVNGKITACNTGAVVISSSALPSGASTEAKQDILEASLVSIEAKMDVDNAVLDIIAANTADLENVNGKITACNTGAVVISSGAVTATLSAIDNAVLDVIAANTADLENVNGKITACNTGAVVVSSSALPSGAATEAKQDVLESSLVSIEAKMDVDNAVLDALELVNTVKDVEWLSNHTVANQSLSDPLDTEGYRGVTLYGENDGAIASGDFKIFGSNESAGTYYHMDSALSLNTSDSGRYCLVESSPLGTMTTARYLKLFNASGSSKTVLKLRAVLSEKMRYL